LKLKIENHLTPYTDAQSLFCIQSFSPLHTTNNTGACKTGHHKVTTMMEMGLGILFKNLIYFQFCDVAQVAIAHKYI
jgi:hypothetical protein